MPEIIQFIIIALFSGATLATLLVLLPTLLPNSVQRAQQIAQNSPGRSLLIGLVNALFFGVLIAIFSQGGELGGLIAAIILLALLMVTAVGLAGLTQIVQERLYPDSGGVKVGLKTAVLIITASLLPLLGWFVLTPVLLLISLGAAIIAFVRRKTDDSAPLP
ncbi:hypothetical protein MNBD_CHLOROFLEXI01-3352 [hydrothermal vent metagenome]|uniref:Uncharacterized protein n=1 Tax=hydrothermal vent metagenome TaxID=652676 RepID=A0A3B0VEQ8_9ZZZZ